MRHLKKLGAMLVAMIMVFAMNCTAFAATITINDPNGKAPAGFAAYQIFDGTLDSTGKILTDITWGAGVTLIGDDTITVGAGENAVEYTAEEAAAALQDETLTTDQFIAAIEDSLTGGLPATADEETDVAVIANAPVGYYLIKNSTAAGNGEAVTKYMLQVVGDVEVDVKTDAPSVEKKVKNDSEADSQYRDANNVAIGDTVNYKITSHVPDMSQYEQYYFIVNDTLSAGLDYAGNLKVMVGTTELDKDTDYTVTEVNGAIEIVFKNFIQYKGQTGADIVITYDAVLNEDCEINATGNPNGVTLTYSNNPNVKGEGTDKPNDNEKDKVTGTTPEDFTITYTTKLAIHKIADDGKELVNATFGFVGTKTNSTVTVTESFEEDEDGLYFKLKDGTYTTTLPTRLTESQYESTETKYTKTVTTTTNKEVVSVNTTVTTDEDGFAEIGSLAEGTYTITELVAPDGYNLLETPLTIVVECTNPEAVAEGTEEATWKITVNGEEISINDDEDIDFDSYIFDIINYAGTTLPSTGGIGTTMFYVAGSILVLVAAVLLIAKKRVARY